MNNSVKNRLSNMDVKDGTSDTVLIVGFVCYDLLFTVPHYPEEDTLTRALDYNKRRGGNASNSCTVLSQLGMKCELLATMATDEYGQFLQNDLKENEILSHHCHLYDNFDTPITYIVLSQSSGTRTIFHHRQKDFPENIFEDFSKLTLSNYKWIHFEGRTFPETLKMIDLVDAWNVQSGHLPIRYSVELEKCCEGTKSLMPRGDVVFVAKEFARFLGYNNPLATIQGISALTKPGAVIIVPWGEEGAMARCSNGDIIKSEAYPPHTVVDSTGAGDTFIAATLFYLSQNISVAESIDFGNRIAGAKCGMMGYKGINSVYSQYLKDCN